MRIIDAAEAHLHCEAACPATQNTFSRMCSLIIQDAEKPKEMLAKWFV